MIRKNGMETNPMFMLYLSRDVNDIYRVEIHRDTPDLAGASHLQASHVHCILENGSPDIISSVRHGTRCQFILAVYTKVRTDRHLPAGIAFLGAQRTL